MRIRPYNPTTDREELAAMHKEQGYDYVFPNFDHIEFFSRLVVEDDDGRLVMALMGRVTCEMFLLMHPNAGTPKERFQNFVALHLESEKDLWRHGMQDAHAFIPPGERMERFKELLRYFGWVPATEWECWTKPQLEGQPKLPKVLKGLRGKDDGQKRTGASQRSESTDVRLSNGCDQGAGCRPESGA